MKLLILHLSDIHFEARSDHICHKADKIKAAVLSHRDIDAYFVVTTGDIAFAGNALQYEIAYDFFTNLKSDSAPANSYYIFVPGNHDCNFQKDNSVRELVVNGILTADIVKNTLSPDASIINTCVSVQDEFFDFLSRISEPRQRPEGVRRLCSEGEFTVGDKRIKVNCYNTAWLSQEHEKQGQLYFPVEWIALDAQKYDLVLSAFHHTYNWLESNNGRAFRQHIESTSDIILTGHEHDSTYYGKYTITGEKPHYTEGGALQQRGSHESCFNLLILDLEQRRQQVFQYDWVDDIYSPRNEADWQGFDRSEKLNPLEFKITTEFLEFLQDPGAALAHPLKSRLTLGDIFVYPNLDIKPDIKASSSKEPFIYSENVVKFFLENSRILVLGSERIGKTSLAKSLYLDLHEYGIVPLFLDGASLEIQNEDKFLKAIYKKFKQQYSDDTLEKYKQLPTISKTVIVDDFDKAKINAKGRSRVIDFLKKHFNGIILLVNSTFQYGDLNETVANTATEYDFMQCGIMKMGYVLRNTIIENWFNLGREYIAEEQELAYKIAHTEKLVDSLLGRNILPSYPIFVLVILQAIEADIEISASANSYVYFYELLIKQSLSKTSGTITIDTKDTFISRLAYRLFETGRRTLSEDEIKVVYDEYFREYKVDFPYNKMMKDLEDALVFQRTDQSFMFKYSYVYYYFVAKFIQENISDGIEGPQLRKHIQEMTQRVYNVDDANILMFLIYLTKDRETILQILSYAKQIYHDHIPYNLDMVTEFLDRLGMDAPKLALFQEDRKQMKAEVLTTQDELFREQQIEREDGPAGGASKEIESATADDDSEDKNLITDFLICLRTLEILGQILRNFPGALKGDLKLEIARESYYLGLRGLSSYLSRIEPRLEEFKDEIQRIVLDAFPDLTENEISEKRGELASFGVMMTTYALIKQIANSVGSAHLKEIYRELLTEDESVAVSLIDLAIKLDYFKGIPEKEILTLHEKTRKNRFSAALLAFLVLEHLYLYPCDYRIRQRICDTLGIPIKSGKLMDNKMKMLKGSGL